MEGKNKSLVIIIVVIFLIILILGIGVLVIKSSGKKEEIVESDEYNRELFVSATLPNIQGNDNISKDEFGKRKNISEEVNTPKKWNNLDFTDFEIYSYNNSTSVIAFNITNNTNMIIETSDFQLQLKDDNLNIVSIVDFDGIVFPCGANVAVTVDITGDIVNVKDIVVDEINYTMQLQGGN